MARLTSTGYPFLVRRPDGASLSYVRRVSPIVRNHLSGEVLCRWTGERRKLGGAATIKISFGTGDLKEASLRWSDVHAQIDRLIENARRRAAIGKARHSTEREVETLSEAQMIAIGDHHYYQILQEEDRIGPCLEERIDRVLRILDCNGKAEAPSLADIIKAEISYHDDEQDTARKALLTEDFSEIERTLYLTNGGDYTPIRPPQSDLCFIFDSEVDEALSRHGISLPRLHPLRAKLGRIIAQQSILARDAIIKRKRDRQVIPTPLPPKVDVLPEETPDGPKLMDVYEMWKTERRPAGRTAEEFLLYAKRFIAICGDLPVGQIVRQHVKEFRDAMVHFPRQIPKNKRHLTVDRLVAWAKHNPNVKTLSISTVNDRAIGAISAILGVAQEENLISDNPCQKVRLKVKVGDLEKRPPYTHDDLAVLLRSSIYTIGDRPRGGGGEAAYWLPLIAMFTGGRLEEIAQLRCSDLKSAKTASGVVHYFDLAIIDKNAAMQTSRKTFSSRRYVPLHRSLIELNLLDYAKATRESGAVRLFPNLVAYRGKNSVAWSKWWGRFARKVFTAAEKDDAAYKNDRSTVFHSFRHSFTDACRASGLEHAIIQDLIGHSEGDMTTKYGNGYALRELGASVDKIHYEGLALPAPWAASASRNT